MNIQFVCKGFELSSQRKEKYINMLYDKLDRLTDANSSVVLKLRLQRHLIHAYLTLQVGKVTILSHDVSDKLDSLVMQIIVQTSHRAHLRMQKRQDYYHHRPSMYRNIRMVG